MIERGQGIIVVMFSLLFCSLLPSWSASAQEETQTPSTGIDEEVQTPSEGITPPGIVVVISNALGEMQTGSASLEDVLATVEESIANGVPPGQIVNVTKYAVKQGLNRDQIVEALNLLAQYISEGDAPGIASNKVKEFIDQLAQTAASEENAVESTQVADKGSKGANPSDDDPPGKDKDDKDDKGKAKGKGKKGK